MSAKNWTEVRKILDDVMDVETSRRQKVLESLDISPEIRAEVINLLEAELECDDFMSLTADDFSKGFGDIFEQSDASPVGQKIGIYEIKRELGAGGMGAVYLAERTDGKFSQKVAIKMLKREFNVEEIRRNFAREKEILSKLNHPYIARLLDAGTTGDGVPFLAMEYIEGVTVDEFCKNLSLNERLKIFNKICEAVSFAHQNLIIHRDLKPSNIIVTAKGEPKLLDFGISKLLDAEYAPKNAVTILGAMTPEYASPEQIKNETVTTATDVYSLGVVLYKILTGSLPFQTNGKHNGDLLKIISEDEPLPPSRMIADCGLRIADLKTKDENSAEKADFLQHNDTRKNKDIAQTTNPQSAIRNPQLLKGDLDNIILKALRKEPERRYKTVEQFSADIWRFIDGLPIEARPATVSYRLNKFYGRNKIAVIAAAIVFISLITGIAVASHEAKNAKEQTQIALESRNTAKSEQEKAEKITRFMSKIIGYANPAWYADGVKFGEGARVIDAIWDLSDKIDTEFSAEPDVAAELHHKFTEVLSSFGKGKTGEDALKIRQKAIFHAMRALQLRKQFYGERHELVAKDLFYLYTVLNCKDAECAAILRDAIQMMRETNPNNLNFPYMLEAYSATLILPESPEKIQEIYRDVARPQADETKFEIAEKMLRESLPLFRLHYKEDNFPVIANECKLAYALAMQEKWNDFDDHWNICRQGVKRLREMPNDTSSFKRFAEIVEKVLAEKRSNK